MENNIIDVMENGKRKVEVFVYDKNVIANVLTLLDKVKVEGVAQASILSALGEYINKPIKQDVVEIDA